MIGIFFFKISADIQKMQKTKRFFAETLAVKVSNFQVISHKILIAPMANLSVFKLLSFFNFFGNTLCNYLYVV